MKFITFIERSKAGDPFIFFVSNYEEGKVEGERLSYNVELEIDKVGPLTNRVYDIVWYNKHVRFTPAFLVPGWNLTISDELFEKYFPELQEPKQ